MKLTARDRWIGWSREQKLRRLHLVTQNSRFVILPGFHAPNLASRVLGLSLRRLAGYRGVTAFAQFAGLLSQQQLQAAGCFYSPSRQCYTYPSITTFHNILATLPPETLETALANWARQQSEHPGEVAQNEEDRAAGASRRKASGTGAARGLHGWEGYPRCLEADRGSAPHAGRGRRAWPRPGAGTARD